MGNRYAGSRMASKSTGASGGGGGTSAAGREVLVIAQGFDMFNVAGSGGSADDAIHIPIRVTAPMKLRALAVRVNGTGSGTHEWGLFDASVDATSATKVAGGTGALNSSGWVQIAASGAPVDLPAGAYVLVFKWPAANAATVYYSFTSQTASLPSMKVQAAYTWDNTPDLTSGWSDNDSVSALALVGDLDGSGNQW